eukprot:GHVO01004881.1.p1 GENE.GHVO01004881.1~~GHVO01004881.1.p1  ORF type:complete len:645 (+),score=85.42 GHVO01004881.1:199-1935(+)
MADKMKAFLDNGEGILSEWTEIPCWSRRGLRDRAKTKLGLQFDSFPINAMTRLGSIVPLSTITCVCCITDVRVQTRNTCYFNFSVEDPTYGVFGDRGPVPRARPLITFNVDGARLRDHPCPEFGSVVLLEKAVISYKSPRFYDIHSPLVRTWCADDNRRPAYDTCNTLLSYGNYGYPSSKDLTVLYEVQSLMRWSILALQTSFWTPSGYYKTLSDLIMSKGDDFESPSRHGDVTCMVVEIGYDKPLKSGGRFRVVVNDGSIIGGALLYAFSELNQNNLEIETPTRIATQVKKWYDQQNVTIGSILRLRNVHISNKCELDYPLLSSSRDGVTFIKLPIKSKGASKCMKEMQSIYPQVPVRISAIKNKMDKHKGGSLRSCLPPSCPYNVNINFGGGLKLKSLHLADGDDVPLTERSSPLPVLTLGEAKMKTEGGCIIRDVRITGIRSLDDSEHAYDESTQRDEKESIVTSLYHGVCKSCDMKWRIETNTECCDNPIHVVWMSCIFEVLDGDGAGDDIYCIKGVPYLVHPHTIPPITGDRTQMMNMFDSILKNKEYDNEISICMSDITGHLVLFDCIAIEK